MKFATLKNHFVIIVQTTNYSKTRTFTRVLSLTLSHDLSNAIAFHSKHLQVSTFVFLMGHSRPFYSIYVFSLQLTAGNCSINFC